MAEIAVLKERLRHEMAELIRELRPKERRHEEKALREKLLEFLGMRFSLSSILLGGYFPLPDELDLFSGIETRDECGGWGNHIIWAFPFIENDSLTFKRATWQELVQMPRGRFQLPEAPNGAEVVDCEAILVPGRAFSHDGRRLGRGKGFYDRYLNEYKGVTIGVAYRQQVISDIPWEGHDRKVDVLASIEGVKPCSLF